MFTSNNRLLKEMLVSQGKCSHGEPLNVFGDLMYLKVSKEDTNGAFTIMEDVIPAHGGPPLHLHHREDEAFFVVEGDYIFEVDGRPMAAHPGDFLWAPRGIRHTFQNQSSSPGRLLITITPGGAEEFFRELAVLAPPPDPVKFLPLFHRYGLEFLGPPLSAR